MKGFGGSSPAKYYFQTTLTDDNNLASPPSDKCWILFNPNGPQKPTASYSPASVQLGQNTSASFTSPACSPSTNPCPASYTYQEGASIPVSKTADSSHNWSGPIQVTQVGPVTMTVYSTDTAGNHSTDRDTQTIMGTNPTTSYKDGYFTGGTYPDLLAIGTGSKPGLWLYPGFANGIVNPPINIGALGLGINPGADGPGDWTGAIALHGDFTGHGVQDVMAYFPPGNSQQVTPGTGVIIGGTGTTSALDPGSGNSYAVNLAPTPGDPSAGPMGTAPSQLTAAGNASGLTTGTEDLIGISTNAAGTASELDLFTNGDSPGTASSGGYNYCQTITATAPGGSSDSWSHYQIAAVGNSAQLVFAFNTTTHVLYESGGPFTLKVPAGSPANTTPTCGNSVVSHPAWTTITGSGTLIGLIQADVNHAGQPEIWDLEGGYPVSYTLSGTTLSPEANNVPTPTNAWALADGNPNVAGATAATALDGVTGATASVTGNYAWVADNQFATDLSLDGTSGYVTPPPTTISSTLPPTISVWFKTTSPGVLASVQGQALSVGSTTTGTYDPVLYIGANGLLYGEWGTSAAGALASTAVVDDGTWHHAVLQAVPLNCNQNRPAVIQHGQLGPAVVVAQCAVQSIWVDGQEGGASTGRVSGSWSNLTFGAGYVGGSWPNYPNNNAAGGAVGISYFNGELSNITLN